MRAGLSFSHSPISLLLRQPLSIKKSYAGAIQKLSGPKNVQDTFTWCWLSSAPVECAILVQIFGCGARPTKQEHWQAIRSNVGSKSKNVANNFLSLCKKF
jgi:hypothetical protein